ncbi:MAG TPA: Mur ligase family protein [Candidatus Levybacteria bacterium]|nr:Mur ligase family protein [Candidatus Levybacteria bacterium]
MKSLSSLLAGKFTNAVIKEFNLGSGSTWPGHVALKVNPQFLKDFLKNKKLNIVLVVGTNGKTTTSKLLRHILEENGHRVFQNEEGANLVNGITTSIIRNTNKLGRISYDTAIFEVDENNLPHILKQITPTAIVFLNLFRDQLDRYGEVHTIAQKWKKALVTLPKSTTIILNADDPEIRYLEKNIEGKTYYFSIPDTYFSKKEITHDTDSTHCPECGTKLRFSKIAYSHLGKYTCTKCGFTNETIKEKIDTFVPTVLSGTYNIYNLQAAIKTAQEIFDLPIEKIHTSLQTFTPAFGRQELIEYKKRNILMLLSKNPAGFNQSLSVIADKDKKSTVLLALNDRIPDGRDVSWIWDVDTDELITNASRIIITGDRAYDMGLRIKYSFADQSSKFTDAVIIKEKTNDAINELIKNTKDGETVYILPTYSAMLELRKILTGKEIL